MKPHIKLFLLVIFSIVLYFIFKKCSGTKKYVNKNKKDIIGIHYKRATGTKIDCNYKDFGELDCKMT